MSCCSFSNITSSFPMSKAARLYFTSWCFILKGEMKIVIAKLSFKKTVDALFLIIYLIRAALSVEIEINKWINKYIMNDMCNFIFLIKVILPNKRGIINTVAKLFILCCYTFKIENLSRGYSQWKSLEQGGMKSISFCVEIDFIHVKSLKSLYESLITLCAENQTSLLTLVTFKS